MSKLAGKIALITGGNSGIRFTSPYVVMSNSYLPIQVLDETY